MPEMLIAEGVENAQLGMVPKNRIATGERTHWLIRHISDPNYDLGIIEISPSAVDELGLDPIGIDRVHDAGTGHPKCIARAFGFPWDFKKDNFPRNGVRGFRALSYGTEPLDPLAWERLYASDLDPTENVVLHYDQDDNIDWDSGLAHPSPAPHPNGMSGGGFWQAAEPLDDSQLWTVGRLNLIAVQTGWYKRSGQSFLRGIQIIYWLHLVSSNYPALRDELENAFPRLKTLQ
ncbi:MAG: hypothetical protein AB7G28_15215 [Pirellulales bacterium]